jgi:hypothetical protein
MAWNRLDRLFINENLKTGRGGLKLKLDSYEIIHDPRITSVHFYDRPGAPHFGSVVAGVPKAYNHQARGEWEAGYSDHFRIRACIEILSSLS